MWRLIISSLENNGIACGNPTNRIMPAASTSIHSYQHQPIPQAIANLNLSSQFLNNQPKNSFQRQQFFGQPTLNNQVGGKQPALIEALEKSRNLAIPFITLGVRFGPITAIPQTPLQSPYHICVTMHNFDSCFTLKCKLLQLQGNEG